MSFSYSLPPQPTTLTGRFQATIRALVTALEGRSAVMLFAFRMLISRRIIDRAREVVRLIEALRAGTLLTRRSPAPGLTRMRRTLDDAEPGAAAAGPKAVLPRGFGWLLPLVPCQAACCGAGLLNLLEDPEMAELLAASPRLVRTLKPLCRMLGVRMPKVPAPIPPAPPSAEPEGAAAVIGSRPSGQATPAAPVAVRKAAGRRVGRWGAGDARLRK
jgi:hypothetical protein